MYCQCNNANLPEIITAIGTLLAVVVALFGKDIRRLWAGPKLSLRLFDSKGEIIKLNNGDSALFFHLIAENKKVDVANNALVFLTRIDENWEGGKRNLWAGEVPLRWKYAEMFPFQARILGAEQQSDLFLVNQNGLMIMTVFKPNNLQIVWEKSCNIYLTAIVKSDQANSKPLNLHIVWDGEWIDSPEEMKKHLSVETVAY